MTIIPVTLHDNGSVSLTGCTPEAQLGYTGTRGVYALQVTPEDVWQGLTIRGIWHPPEGEAPPSTLVEDGLVIVPASITLRPGRGVLTFEGTDGQGVTVTSADLPYRVGVNSGTDDGTAPEPGTPAWEAFVAQAVKARLPIATEEEVDAMLAEIFDT